MTDRPTHRAGLIGWPVEHSVSPAMHNAAFKELGLPWQYSLLPTPSGTLESTLAALPAKGYRGVNVTVPHKQAVLAHLDEIDQTAQVIGAVNTVLIRENRMSGFNTDGYGFIAALREEGFDVAGCQALVLGAGGAARSVVCALARAGCEVTIHNRTTQRAHRLAQDLGQLDCRAMAVASLFRLDLDRFELLVNTTSVGMWPQSDASPWPDELPLPSHLIVFDLVYNPPETQLLARARAEGATGIGGLGMLVHQGAQAFEIWTGQSPPIEIMQTAAQEALVRSRSQHQ